MNIKSIKKDQGFTIVELLIVIVVIGILAAITLVAFNGVQNRGKTAAGQSAANSVVKKAQAYYTIESSYPATIEDFEDAEESKLEGLNVIPDALTGNQSDSTVRYVACGSGAGAQVSYWDYTKTTGNATTQTLGTCTP